ncbi:hypothetical protein [Nostoc sp.]|uniref:hypothetical protein n=1 Tax=Nostoc sp. TaxID=1180 RepID=UPI002FFC9BBF
MSNEWMKNGYLLITYYLLLITPVFPRPFTAVRMSNVHNYDYLVHHRDRNPYVRRRTLNLSNV